MSKTETAMSKTEIRQSLYPAEIQGLLDESIFALERMRADELESLVVRAEAMLSSAKLGTGDVPAIVARHLVLGDLLAATAQGRSHGGREASEN